MRHNRFIPFTPYQDVGKQAVPTRAAAKETTPGAAKGEPAGSAAFVFFNCYELITIGMDPPGRLTNHQPTGSENGLCGTPTRLARRTRVCEASASGSPSVLLVLLVCSAPADNQPWEG